MAFLEDPGRARTGRFPVEERSKPRARLCPQKGAIEEIGRVKVPFRCFRGDDPGEQVVILATAVGIVDRTGSPDAGERTDTRSAEGWVS